MKKNKVKKFERVLMWHLSGTDKLNIDERQNGELEEILEMVKECYHAINRLERIYGSGRNYLSRWEDGGELSVDTNKLIEDLDRLRIGFDRELKAGYNDRYV